MSVYKFNIYSWILAIVYVFVAVVLEVNSPQPSMHGVYTSFPLFVLLIFWSERIKNIIRLNDRKITRKEAFIRDLFFITCGCTLAFILPLAFVSKNPDVQGWWALGLVVGAMIGFFYAFVFSLISLMVIHHKKRTVSFVFFVVFIILVEFFVPQSIIPRYISLPYGFNIEFFHFFISMYLFICFFCLMEEMFKQK